MTEITRYNLENILHDEKMKEIKKRTEKIQKKLRNRKAEDEKIFKHKGMNMTEGDGGAGNKEGFESPVAMETPLGLRDDDTEGVEENPFG